MSKTMMLLTKTRSGANRVSMKRFALPLAAVFATTLGGCVTVKAPDKPIEINLNVNIRQEVIYTLKKDAESLITENPELFPK
jgi:YnbE-like lipoprotein